MSHQTRVVPLAQLSLPATSAWGRLRWIGLAVGVIGAGATALLAQDDPEQFNFSWLVAFMFFLSLGLGALFFVLVHYASKAGWGIAVRRLAENVSSGLLVMPLLFLPVLLGLHDLYHWSDADAVAHDPLLQAKEPFLNPSFFTVRAGIYFALWILITLFYVRGSSRQDTTGEESITRRLTAASGPSLIIFALTLTFAAFDWIMSLDPHWYSTMFGVYYFAGSLVGGFAVLILLAAGLIRAGYLKDVVTVEHLHDLGKLLFAFSVFWAYIGFSQYFLIWYANIPEETIFFLHRSEGSWAGLTMFLAWGHFAVPFFFLMPRTIKRKGPFLVLGACWMLMMHLIDLYWLVMPTLHKYEVRPHLLDLTSLLAVGGLFLAAVGWAMAGKPLIPVKDPRINESLSFENF